MKPAGKKKDGSRGRRTTKTGMVTSDKMDKTVLVKVITPVEHPKYQRIVRKTTSFMAHDPENRCGVGDLVEIRECRPLSRRKRWRVIRIMRAASRLATAPRSNQGESRP